MIRPTILLFCFGIIMILVVPILTVHLIFQLLRLKKWDYKVLVFCEYFWSRSIVWLSGCPVTIQGLEHLPEDDKFCLISNHQGSFDIILLLGSIPRLIGFIAKKELMMVPILNFGMVAIHCVFIDRKNPRKALKGIEKGISNIHKGNALVIFPEGTRSKGPKMGPFKTGNIRMLTRQNIPILPVTVDGSYRVFAGGYKINKTPLKVIVHPLVETAGLSDAEKQALPEKLREMIQAEVAF